MTKKKFETICEDTFNSYKEFYITERVKNIDDTLDSFVREVYASYYNHNTDSKSSIDITYEIIISKYIKKLRNYLQKKGIS